MEPIGIKKFDIIVGKSECPFCGAHIDNRVGDTFIQIDVSPREISQHMVQLAPCYSKIENELRIEYLICPYCEKTSYKVYDCNQNLWVNIFPLSNCKQFPDSVPKEVYKDYSEACNILSLSPSASATLSRRCLQKMIRNHWGIELSNLVNEINTIPNTNISNLERNALHAIRQIGNIGAHPDKILDVEPEDAELTIKIIEIFLQKWYVDDPANQNLLEKAIETNRLKQNAKLKK